jgi:hypothetical protein
LIFHKREFSKRLVVLELRAWVLFTWNIFTPPRPR